MNYIKGINGLRAVAVILVVLNHWGFPFGIKYVIDGKIGVDLFFVISGFLITRILLENKNKERSPYFILKNFYVRRILRIFPIYYLSIIILYFLEYPDIKDKLLYFLTYTENFEVFIHQSWNSWSHSWSLSVEEQFYLIWPFVIILVPQNKEKLLIYFFITIGLISQPLIWFITKNPFVFVLTPTCISALGIGALISVWEHENKIELYFKYYKWLIPFLLIFMIYWSFALHGGHFQYFKRLNTSLLSGFLIILCLRNTHNHLENPILKNIGIVSYGIYLFHYPWSHFYDILLNKIHMIFNSDYVYFGHAYPDVNYFLKLLTLLIFSFLSFYTIERFFLSFKRFFT